MGVVQSPEEIAAEMEEGFRQIEDERTKAEDAAQEEYYYHRLNDADDCEDEYLEEPTEVNVGDGPGGLLIFE